MSIRQLSLRVPDSETGEWREVGLTLIPEYWFREAARFGLYRWGEYLRLKPRPALAIVAHWMAHTIYGQHTQDALALEQERRDRQARATAAANGRH